MRLQSRCVALNSHSSAILSAGRASFDELLGQLNAQLYGINGANGNGAVRYENLCERFFILTFELHFWQNAPRRK
jgi:hypothetical protein